MICARTLFSLHTKSTTNITAIKATSFTNINHFSTSNKDGNTPRVVISNTTDPFFNMATEEWLFRNWDYKKHSLLYLWRNDPVVFIGRNQNPWKECHVANLERDKVHLVRRFSGGGAVYQDLGNTCWTILNSKENHSAKVNTAIITNALQQRFSINAEASGRNDIVVDSQKVSGSAFKMTTDRVCHHGTLLLDVNLSNMAKYLNPSKEKLISKGVASVQARVTNLKKLNAEVEHAGACHAIISSFLSPSHNTSSTSDDKLELTTIQVEIEYLQHDTLAQIPELKETYNQLLDWDWRFGQTPNFEHNISTRFDWGIMDLHIDSNKGKISKVKLFSDSLYPDMIDLISHHLQGATYNEEGVVKALANAADEADDATTRQFITQYSLFLSSAL